MDKTKMFLWMVVIVISALVLVPLTTAVQKKLHTSAAYDAAIVCDYDHDLCEKLKQL